MEISTDLVVKIVVLLTAVVGLYKAANFETAKPFIEYLFASLSILVVPAAMLGFLLIGKTMTALTAVPEKPLEKYDGPDAEVMYRISRSFWNQAIRQDALKLTIERALETKQWGVVVMAAKDLNPTSQSDPVLMRAVKALAGEKVPVPSTQPAQ